jgi:hypothetical protein
MQNKNNLKVKACATRLRILFLSRGHAIRNFEFPREEVLRSVRAFQLDCSEGPELHRSPPAILK